MATRTHHRDHRPRRPLPGRIADRQGLPGPRAGPRPEQSEGRDRAGREPRARADRRRPHRPVVADRRGRAGPARRGLQPRRDQLRAAVVQPARAHRGHHRLGRAPHARSDPHRRRHRNNPIRFYQASSSEMFGKVHETPQTRDAPRSTPARRTATAKVFGYYTTLNYRESYGIHASNGILFNHTSPRRGLEFVSARSPTPSPGSRSACRTASPSATSTPRGTAGTRATTSRPCG